MEFSLALGVTPELLKSKSFEVSDDVRGMIQDTQRMIDEISGTGSYWLGEAGNAQRQKLIDNFNEMNAILERMNGYPPKICEMAGIYESAEEYNTALSSSLAADIELRM